MTKNKKKLRRVEKRYSVTKSAQTLVLTGLLLAGGVTGALAASETVAGDAWKTGATVTSGQDFTTSGSMPMNATLTVKDGGKITIAKGSGIIDKNEDAAVSKVILESGSTTSVLGRMDIGTIDVQKGATVTLTGTSGSSWDAAAYMGGYEGLTVNGKVTMEVNSEMFIGRNSYNANNGNGFTLAIGDGANILMEGTSTGSDFDGNAAHIWAGSPGTMDDGTTEMPKNLLSITGGKITVTEDKYGVISSQVTEMSGGEIAVDGNLLIQANTGAKGNSGTIVYSGVKTGEFTLSGGEINVDKTGNLFVGETMAFDVAGGTVNNAGRIYATGATTLSSGTLNLSGAGGMIGSATDAFTDVTGTFTMTDGELNVGAGTQGSQMQMDKVTIAGGNVNIQGKVGDISDTWTDNSMIYGGMGETTGAGVVISGGTVTIGNNGQIGVGYDNTAANSMDISDGKVILQGDSAAKAAMLRASSSNTTEASDNTYSKLNISNAAAIEVAAGKYGAIISRETNMSGGTLNVDGSLVVAGSMGAGEDITDGIDKADKKWGTFNLDGGAVTVGANGLLDFVTGAVALKAGGDATLKSNLTLQSTALAGTAKGTYAKDLTVTKSLTVDGGLDVKAAALAKVNNGGSLMVTGTTKVNTAGGIVVGDTTTKGSLSITKGSLFTADATSGKLKNNTDIVANGITLSKDSSNNSTGTLIIDGFSGTIKAGDFDASALTGSTLSQVLNSKLNLTSYEGNNVILKGAVLDGASADISGSQDAAAPVELNITGGKVTAEITAPSVKTSTGSLELGTNGILTLDANAANAGVSTTTTLENFTTTAGTTNVANGARLQVTEKADLTGSTTTVSAGSSFVAAETVMGTGTQVNVLNSTSDLGTLRATAGTLFVDPAYVTIDHVDGDFGAQLLAGAGGVVNVGTRDQAWINEAITKSGANADASVLALQSGISLATDGQIVVDKNLTQEADGSYKLGGTVVAQATQGSLHFGDNSLLIVDAASFSGTTAALTLKGGSNDKLTTSDKNGEAAKLHIYGGKAGDTVKVVAGAISGIDATTATAGWTTENVSFSSALLAVDKIDTGTGTKYDVKTKGVNARNTFTLLSGDMGAIANAMVSQVGIQVDHPNAGIRFMSRALDDRYIGRNNATEAAATIEGAARLAVVGATQGITMSAVTAGTSAATSRTSMASPLQSQKAQVVALNGETSTSGLNAGDVKNGVGLWIMPLYQSNNTWGMKAGEFKTGYTSDLGGVAIGADYTFAEAFRVGVAFNIGGGYAQSQGDFNKTDNNFNFWGVNLYGGWSQNNFGITADVGYTSTYSKLEQELQSSMDMGNIKADVTSSAITAGLRGEYKFETEALDIIPHVGVRYMSLMTDSYDAKSHGTVFSADESYQSIWTFPIGVTFTKEIVNASGWAFKPQLDLQIIPAAGDVKAKSKVRVPGIDASADLSTRVMDDITYGGGVGFDIRKDNVSFGVNYNLQASEHSTAHGVFATVRYEF